MLKRDAVITPAIDYIKMAKPAHYVIDKIDSGALSTHREFNKLKYANHIELPGGNKTTKSTDKSDNKNRKRKFVCVTNLPLTFEGRPNKENLVIRVLSQASTANYRIDGADKELVKLERTCRYHDGKRRIHRSPTATALGDTNGTQLVSRAEQGAHRPAEGSNTRTRYSPELYDRARRNCAILRTQKS